MTRTSNAPPSELWQPLLASTEQEQQQQQQQQSVVWVDLDDTPSSAQQSHALYPSCSQTLHQRFKYFIVLAWLGGSWTLGLLYGTDFVNECGDTFSHPPNGSPSQNFTDSFSTAYQIDKDSLQPKLTILIEQDDDDSDEGTTLVDGSSLAYQSAKKFVIDFEVWLYFTFSNQTSHPSDISIHSVESFYHYEVCCHEYGLQQFVHHTDDYAHDHQQEDGGRNINEGNATFISVSYSSGDDDAVFDFNELVMDYCDEKQLTIDHILISPSSAVIDRIHTKDTFMEDLQMLTMVTLPAILCITYLTLKSLNQTLLALLALITSLATSSSIMYFIMETLEVPLAEVVPIVMASLQLVLCVLFTMIRGAYATANVNYFQTIEKGDRLITVSSMSMLACVAMLWLMPTELLRSIGVGGGVATLSSLAVHVSFVPAFLYICEGRRQAASSAATEAMMTPPPLSAGQQQQQLLLVEPITAEVVLPRSTANSTVREPNSHRSSLASTNAGASVLQSIAYSGPMVSAAGNPNESSPPPVFAAVESSPSSIQVSASAGNNNKSQRNSYISKASTTAADGSAPPYIIASSPSPVVLDGSGKNNQRNSQASAGGGGANASLNGLLQNLRRSIRDEMLGSSSAASTAREAASQANTTHKDDPQGGGEFISRTIDNNNNNNNNNDDDGEIPPPPPSQQLECTPPPPQPFEGNAAATATMTGNVSNNNNNRSLHRISLSELRESLWYKLGQTITNRYTGQALLCTILLFLLPLSYYGACSDDFGAKSFDVDLWIPEHSEAAMTHASIDEFFGPGKLVPYMVLMDGRRMRQLVDNERGFAVMQTVVSALDERCGPAANVTAFAGIAVLNGTYVDPAEYHEAMQCVKKPASCEEATITERQRTLGVLQQKYNSDDRMTTLIQVQLSIDPYSHRGMDWLESARSTLNQLSREEKLQGYEVTIGAGASIAYDVVEHVYEEFPLVMIAMFLTVFVIAGTFFDSLQQPIRAVATTMLSLTATYGLAKIKYGDDLGWLPPLLSFSIALGLSVSYDMFINLQILEHRRSRQRMYNNASSIILGLYTSGSYICAGAVITAIAFSGLLLTEELALRQFGFLMCEVILIDAVVVRIFLIPLLIGNPIFGKAAWWPMILPPETRDISDI